MSNSAAPHPAVLYFAQVAQCCASAFPASPECASSCDEDSCHEFLRQSREFPRSYAVSSGGQTYVSVRQAARCEVHSCCGIFASMHQCYRRQKSLVRRDDRARVVSGWNRIVQQLSSSVIKSSKGAVPSTACRRCSTALVVQTCWGRPSRAVSMRTQLCLLAASLAQKIRRRRETRNIQDVGWRHASPRPPGLSVRRRLLADGDQSHATSLVLRPRGKTPVSRRIH